MIPGIGRYSMRRRGAIWTPAELALGGFWWSDGDGSDYPSGGAWPGRASAGASGSRNLAALGTAPSVGTAVGGAVPADYSGSNYLTTGIVGSSFGSASGLCFAFLVRFAAAPGNWAGLEGSRSLIGDTGGWMGVTAGLSGGKVRIGYWAYNSAASLRSVELDGSTAPATEVWCMIFARYDGANMLLRLNKETPVTGGAMTVMRADVFTNVIQMGRNSTSSPVHRRMGTLAGPSASWADCDKIYDWAKARNPSLGLP
jgi:hypothetical protein